MSIQSTSPIQATLPPYSVDAELYSQFQQMMLTTFKVDKVSDLPVDDFMQAFQIYHTQDDFVFDDQSHRLGSFLLLMACLHTYKKQEQVCYISPTYFYAQQAAAMRSHYLQGLSGTKDYSFSCVVPGMSEFAGEVMKCQTVFMHGKDFSQYLPKE